jgi:hypothetical protein
VERLEKVKIGGIDQWFRSGLRKANPVLLHILGAPGYNQTARFLPHNQVAIRPQCGFAFTIEDNLRINEEQWSKLQLTVDVACEVWG